MELKSLKIIEVAWKGEYYFQLKGDKINIVSVEGKEEPKIGEGIYQIYGTHPVHGENQLLYIGKSADISGRMLEHYRVWMKDEQSNMKLYFGSVGGKNDNRCSLDIVEKLLIYYCAPPYNSQNIIDLKDSLSKKGTHTLILNLMRRNMLPYEVSTFWYHSSIWDKKGGEKTPMSYDLNFTSSPF